MATQRCSSWGETLTIAIGIGEHRIGGPEERTWVMHGSGRIGLVIADPLTHISSGAHFAAGAPPADPTYPPVT